MADKHLKEHMPKALLGFGAIIVAYVLYTTCVGKEEVVAQEKVAVVEEKVEAV